MPLKRADDKSQRVALLEEILALPGLEASQKRWARDELGRLRKGIQGEKDAAFFLDQHFADAANHVILHDLRLVVDGDVAQIDHLIINRAFGFYLIETKNYAGNVVISPHGEFTVEYDFGRFGVPSPIEQSHRHERILRKMLERLGIANRIGTGFEFHHVVMFHPKAIITRPPAKVFDTANIIKADQFPSWHKTYVEKEVGLTAAFKGLANVRSLETITEWGEKLKRQHRPEDTLALPEFMVTALQDRLSAPGVPVVAPAPSAASAAEPPRSSSAADKACPRCGSPMVLRTARKGSTVGAQFWGCSGFPKCRGTVAIQSTAS